MPEKNKREYEFGGWHLRKDVTIGQIVTIITLGISLVWWAATIENRVGQVDLKYQAEVRLINERHKMFEDTTNYRFDRYQKQVSEALAEIKGGIQRLNEKIDKKADK